MKNIIGISAYYHDSAAALVRDGDIVAAAQEERFSRKKHDARFPINALRFCLKEGNLLLKDIDYIVFYDKPLIKFERLLETYLTYAPRGFNSFLSAMPIWLKEKLYLKTLLKNELSELAGISIKELPELLFTEHHESHAASAFYPSPFEKAAVLCLDGVGEWATTTVWQGEKKSLTLLWELDFPHSLGLLYSAFTYYTGFKVNSGEYKIMGLAPYGEPKYTKLILDKLIDLKDDGTYKLNMEYFNYPVGLTMTNENFANLFGGPPRRPEGEVTQKEMDLARSIQEVTEEIVLRLGHTIYKETDNDYLCLAGGVALNCVANGRLLREGPFKDIWIQPAAGDAGGALGAALRTIYIQSDIERRVIDGKDSMKGAYLGISYKRNEIESMLGRLHAKYRIFDDTSLLKRVAELLADEKVIGWFQGKMEFGPRALGGRSIIADPRSRHMQSTLNLKIKYRESFRPFAPSVLIDHVEEYFELDRSSPYMLLVAPVQKNKRINMTESEQRLFGIEKLNVPRSEVPSITHVDYSARIQTVHSDTNPRYYNLIKEFFALTGCPLLVNTSFNVRGEPIVCTPEDAYRCFMRTEMDCLVIDNYLLFKEEQPVWNEKADWREEYELD